jgi:hypothetical protein
VKTIPVPFAPSEVEGPSRAKPRVHDLAFARLGVSTEFIQSAAAGGVEGLDTNG